MSRSLAKWDRRIERANELAAAHPFAAEALRFYARIASFQKSLYAGLESVPGSLRDGLELSILLPCFAPFLSLIEDAAPPPLAQSAAELSAGRDRWGQVLEEFWRGDKTLTAAETLLSWTFLQPYAEHLADHTEQAATQAAPPLCPHCSGRPQVGVLRQQGDGAKRSLICSLC
ncbi:MAG TPA: formate dehydrogenase accessory protein FdhE, partial [Thermoanaerobaculia bacterium]|nr:formate dehydrogenase accessory protein FdhE [Thermoanaerobaculia bacterium]